MNRLVLLDRDGVINRDSGEFVKTVAEFVPIPGSVDAIARLHRSGLRIGVATNQSGIGRGLLTEATLAAIHGRLDDLVRAEAGVIDAFEHCPHLPEDGCQCRKPLPGMLLRLMARLGAGPSETVCVGDSLRDLEAAIAAGCEPVLVRTGNGADCERAAGELGVSRVHDSLAAFADAEIKARETRRRVHK